ncbi:hypothetical protein KSP40_PGU015167 [Platanthera guangdongensis]|uniref:Heat shock factor binding protein 1 n=1 Tax=Platanthera guangdongensis TaxID=2320717 RepID=A0ABR2LVT2_9ASPA
MAATPNSSASKGEHESDELMQNTSDMTAFVQNLLLQMQTRFQTMSESIIGKNILCAYFKSFNEFTNIYIFLGDEMGSRIDELEECMNDLKAEMGVETPTKTPQEPKPSDGSS